MGLFNLCHQCRRRFKARHHRGLFIDHQSGLLVTRRHLSFLARRTLITARLVLWPVVAALLVITLRAIIAARLVFLLRAIVAAVLALLIAILVVTPGLVVVIARAVFLAALVLIARPFRQIDKATVFLIASRIGGRRRVMRLGLVTRTIAIVLTVFARGVVAVVALLALLTRLLLGSHFARRLSQHAGVMLGVLQEILGGYAVI